MNTVSILIPAYQPSADLVDLCARLHDLPEVARVIVVNDGSDAACDGIFQRLREADITVLQHEANQGKGAALKTGMSYWYQQHFDNEAGLVTADADGQHAVEDVQQVAKQLIRRPNALHLGVRRFKQGDIPFRSRFGNILTAWVLKVAARLNLIDTQTGLRGLPKSLIQPMMQEKESGYELELKMLLLTKQLGIKIKQHPIRTIYIDDNSSSHFQPVRDSVKIYWVFFKFFSSSIVAALLDYGIFMLCYAFSHSILLSGLSARLVSSLVNFFCNKNFVFARHGRAHFWRAMLKYYVLAVFVVFASIGLIKLLALAGITVYIGKILADTLLYFVSFFVQNKLIFKRKRDLPWEE